MMKNYTLLQKKKKKKVSKKRMRILLTWQWAEQPPSPPGEGLPRSSQSSCSSQKHAALTPSTPPTVPRAAVSPRMHVVGTPVCATLRMTSVPLL